MLQFSCKLSLRKKTKTLKLKKYICWLRLTSLHQLTAHGVEDNRVGLHNVKQRSRITASCINSGPYIPVKRRSLAKELRQGQTGFTLTNGFVFLVLTTLVSLTDGCVLKYHSFFVFSNILLVVLNLYFTQQCLNLPNVPR